MIHFDLIFFFFFFQKSWNGITKKIIQDTFSKEKITLKEPGIKKNNHRHRTLYVTNDCDVASIFKDEFQLDPITKEISLGLVGLHTCGDLSSTALRIFSKQSHFNFLCTVGCCYHLLTDSLLETNPDHGFPMSQFLTEKQYSLGKNARMLASQSFERNSRRDNVWHFIYTLYF